MTKFKIAIYWISLFLAVVVGIIHFYGLLADSHTALKQHLMKLHIFSMIYMIIVGAIGIWVIRKVSIKDQIKYSSKPILFLVVAAAIYAAYILFSSLENEVIASEKEDFQIALTIFTAFYLYIYLFIANLYKITTNKMGGTNEI